jgi:hypothetical protein
MKIVRRLRLIEYVGTEEWVNKQLEGRHLKGTKTLEAGSIREALIGDANEIMAAAEVMQVIAERQARGVE